jgi:tetratricopeptide (TPR) repeat protein
MKPGINSAQRKTARILALFLICGSVASIGGFAAPVRAEGPSVDPDRRTAALEKEAYYHFFLGDYLTAATRLKLIEETAAPGDHRLSEARLLLGGLYIAWGMYGPATALFDRWVEQFPQGSSRNEILLLIERLQYQRGLYHAALDTFGLLTPEDTLAWMEQARYLAGMSHYILGSYPEAIRILQSIPPSSVYFPYARMTMAQSHARLDDFEDSVSLLRRLGVTDPAEGPAVKPLSEKSRLTLGYLLVELGRLQEARPVFSSIPATSPFYPDALFGEGWAAFDAGRYPEALPLFQKLNQSFPDHRYALEGLLTIGASYQKLGALAKADQSYGEALEIYGRKEKEIGALRSLVQDRDRLADWLNRSGNDPEDRAGRLLDDDRLRFRIGQYREISTLRAYLDRKLDDMAIFQIMVDHRAEVFRGHLPTLGRFLNGNPVEALREKGRLLQSRIEEAVRTERVESLATRREREELDPLTDARSRARALRNSIERVQNPSPDIIELKKQLDLAVRRLDLFHGELVWKVITEAPGRIDDLQRDYRNLSQELAALEAGRNRLTASVPSLEDRIDRFRQRIQRAHQSLRQEREKAADLQGRLLPPLQALLLQALDNKRAQIDRWAATARLSQIQVHDKKGRP